MSAHIALFLPSLRGGGAERVMVKLANAFAALGHRVDLVLISSDGPYRAEVSEQVRIVDFAKTRVLSGLVPLARYLRRERPDALLSAMTHANVVALGAKLLAGGPTRVAVSERSAPSLNLRGGRANWILRRTMRLLYPGADVIISVSQGVSRELRDDYGIPSEKLAVVYNPIDAEKIRLLMREPVSHPWMAAKETPVILAAGRLNVAKDYPTLLRAFALLSRRLPARLVILGQGEDEQSLKKTADDLGIASDVLFAGFQANPFAWMHRCDVYVMSSIWEGLPGSLLEALACGARVVSTDCPSGPREILEDGKWGRLVPTGNPEALAAAMEAALSEAPRPGSDEALARFRSDKVVHDYLGLLLGA